MENKEIKQEVKEIKQEVKEIKPKVKEVENKKITNNIKVKNPKRVEAGKRLAAISKIAKEKKMKERIELLNTNNNINKKSYYLELSSVIIAALSLWIAYTSYTKMSGLKPKPKQDIIPQKNVFNNLESL